MDNLITISNAKSNTLEFEAELTGLDKSEMSVKFIIDAHDMRLGFDAKHLEGNKWEVTIPPLSMLEQTAYPFHIDVTSGGYFFEPLKGTVNLVGSHDVYVTTPKKVTAPHTPTNVGMQFTTPDDKPIKIGQPLIKSTEDQMKSVNDAVKKIMTAPVEETIQEEKPSKNVTLMEMQILAGLKSTEETATPKKKTESKSVIKRKAIQEGKSKPAKIIKPAKITETKTPTLVKLEAKKATATPKKKTESKSVIKKETIQENKSKDNMKDKAVLDILSEASRKEVVSNVVKLRKLN